ncbi:hypothetical protein V6N13_009309 [Hibiscus sabdariffa]
MPLMPWATHVLQWTGQRVAIPRGIHIYVVDVLTSFQAESTGLNSFFPKAGRKVLIKWARQDISSSIASWSFSGNYSFLPYEISFQSSRNSRLQGNLSYGVGVLPANALPSIYRVGVLLVAYG